MRPKKPQTKILLSIFGKKSFQKTRMHNSNIINYLCLKVIGMVKC